MREGKELILHREHEAESIRNRDTIDAPPNFVSVYHETRLDALDDIDTYGLQYDTENSNFMDSPQNKEGVLASLNKTLEKLRPDWAKKAGLDRRQVIYGYLDLETGHGMGGYADEAFSDRKHQDTFETMRKYGPETLEKFSVTTWKEWKAYVLSEIQKRKAGGAILELKVDPKACYVGDIHNIEEARYPDLPQDVREERLQQYWDSMITLEDLQRWYRVPHADEDLNQDLADPTLFRGFAKLKEAPANLPDEIDQPEVLVTKDVPQKHIRMVA
jgi:hypothetical protein